MTTPYQAPPPASSHRRDGARASAFGTRSGLCHAFRRPLALAAAAVAVAGVTAAGYAFAARPAGPASAARPATFAASLMAGPAVTVLPSRLSDTQVDANAALARARRASEQRASALIQRQKVAAKARAAALQKARRAAAARAAREQAQVREAAAARASREQTRRGLVARAQSNPRAVASLLVADHGWSAEQFGCLERLWNKESSWRWDADNPSSDAYGIPQSLPGSKMASFGSDWETNPITQIKWGLQYISDSYGTPCSAWAHSQAVNWY